jgi:Family of unknown function (DUF6069)
VNLRFYGGLREATDTTGGIRMDGIRTASTPIDRPTAGSGPTGARPLWRAGALAVVSAAVGAVAVALGAKAIDIPLVVDGDEIPVPGFALITLFWSAVGVGMAYAFARWARRPTLTFVLTTVVLTALSIVPVVTADAETATQVTLALSHVAAAAIVIPTLAFQLPRRRELL